MMDITNVSSSSKTSLPLLPMQYKAKKITGPKVVPQLPTSIKEVVPQEFVLQLDTSKIEDHSEANIIEDTTTMLHDLGTSMIMTIAQLNMPRSLEVSIKRYATWFINENHSQVSNLICQARLQVINLG